jgi:hypothetical protein
MTIDRTTPRPEITYLRRRPKRPVVTQLAAPATPIANTPKIDTRRPDRAPASSTQLASATPKIDTRRPAKPQAVRSGGVSLTSPSVAATPVAAAAPNKPAATSVAPSASLSLGGARKARQTPVSLAPTIRPINGRVMLDATAPSARYNRRQSAIGSLGFQLDGSGVLGVLWELNDGTTGIVGGPEGAAFSESVKGRPVLEQQGGQVLLGLRRVTALRRLLVVVGGFQGEQAQRVVAQSGRGDSLESSHTATGTWVSALACYGVHGEIIVRREGYGFDSLDGVANAYGFQRNWTPPLR